MGCGGHLRIAKQLTAATSGAAMWVPFGAATDLGFTENNIESAFKAEADRLPTAWLKLVQLRRFSDRQPRRNRIFRYLRSAPMDGGWHRSCDIVREAKH